MCSQTVRTFCILLRETFSNSIAFALINKYSKGAVVQILTVFVPLYHVAFRRVFRNRTFRRLSNHGFPSPYFWEYISYETHHFFENFQIFIYISKMPKKSWHKIFYFRDKCISIGYIKLSLLRREYFWSVVNVVKNSPEILPVIKRDFFQLNCVHSDQQICYKWCHLDFCTVWSHLPCCLSKGPLKRDFFNIYLSTFFGICNLGNTSAMRSSFVQSVQNFSYISKMQKKIQKKLFVF